MCFTGATVTRYYLEGRVSYVSKKGPVIKYSAVQAVKAPWNCSVNVLAVMSTEWVKAISVPGPRVTAAINKCYQG